MKGKKEIKFKNGRAYRYDRMQMRFFPIKMSEALNMFANGTAVSYVEI